MNFENSKNKEVAYLDQPVVKIAKKNLITLKKNSEFSKYKKSRFCCHKNRSDSFHEMIIFHKKKYYIRPHKHTHSSESIHVIKGRVDVFLFNSNGDIFDIIKMGDLSSNYFFFYRINKNIYHSFLIKSPELIFHETTKGPFKKKNTVFAKWSPKKNFFKYKKILQVKIKLYEKKNIISGFRQ
jgi:cupin fold WbuC family metalloprotein